MSLEELPNKLYNVGLSYKKADVKTRSTFSISKQKQQQLLESAKQKGMEGLIVLSTCNRTEITGFAKHPFQLISLLIEHSKGCVEEFIDVANVYKNKEAIRHLFHIGTGLDSQILGDYEIVGQLKESFKQAKEAGTTNAYLERLMNLVLQASKEVKNTTQLSSGTTSVSYAAIQYLIENCENYNQKNILLYGLGNIGKNTCKNLLEYTKNSNITLINRSFDKLKEFKIKYPSVRIAPFEKLNEEITKTDVLVVATGANITTINKSNIPLAKEMLILDLSMPENVATEVEEINGVTLVNIDELSKITNKTIEIRQQEIPKAKEVIAKYKKEFLAWISDRKYIPAVNALKTSLQNMQHDEIDFHAKKIKDFNVEQAEAITSRIINKITTRFIQHLKDENTSVDQSIDVIEKMFNIKELDLNENH